MSSSTESSKAGDWFRIYAPGESRKAKLFGYEKQTKAGISIALSVIDGPGKHLLIFGIPGNGKTSFPEVLVQHLKDEQDIDFSLTTLLCDRIPLEIQDRKQTIAELNYVIEKSLEVQPVIISFDSIDLLCPHISAVPPSASSFSVWMRRLLKDELVRRNDVLILGITNYPLFIEPSVKRNFHISMYLEPTPLSTARKLVRTLIVDKIGAKKAEEVTDKYLKAFERLRMRPMGAEIVSACRMMRENHPDFNTLSTSDIVTILQANTPIVPTIREINDFEKENQDLIVMSNDYHIPYWLDVYRATKKMEKYPSTH